MEYKFVTSAELRALMHVSASFLRDRRISKQWENGIHWVYLNDANPRAGVRYNAQLCLNWLAFKNTSAHEHAVREYLATLNPAWNTSDD
jgi:hypothetical protein